MSPLAVSPRPFPRPRWRQLSAPLRVGGAADGRWSRMRLAIAGSALYVLAYAAWFLTTEATGREYAVRSDVFFLPTFLAPAIGAWLSARRAEGPARPGWRALSVAYLLLFCSSVVWLAADVVATAGQTTLLQKRRR